MLVLDTVENCSLSLVQRSLELVLPIAHDSAIGDNVAVMSCIIALSCILQITTASHSTTDEEEVKVFVSYLVEVEKGHE